MKIFDHKITISDGREFMCLSPNEKNKKSLRDLCEFLGVNYDRLSAKIAPETSTFACGNIAPLGTVCPQHGCECKEVVIAY